MQPSSVRGLSSILFRGSSIHKEEDNKLLYCGQNNCMVPMFRGSMHCMYTMYIHTHQLVYTVRTNAPKRDDILQFYSSRYAIQLQVLMHVCMYVVRTHIPITKRIYYNHTCIIGREKGNSQFIMVCVYMHSYHDWDRTHWSEK